MLKATIRKGTDFHYGWLLFKWKCNLNVSFAAYYSSCFLYFRNLNKFGKIFNRNKNKYIKITRMIKKKTTNLI